MAIFKDKTGRGEVNYAQGPVLAEDGTVLVLNDISGQAQNFFAPGAITHTVFQLRGESTGVADVSSNVFTVTESSTLTKRIENINHNTRLKTFEFSGGKSLSLSASLQPGPLGSPGPHKEFFGVVPFSTPASQFYHRTINDTTILPYQSSQSPYGSTGHEAIISGWIYIDSYNTTGNEGGSCIMESVSGTSRGFGVIVSSTGELIFRKYDWGADSTLSNSSTRDFQQIKTQKKLALRTWYHFTIFFHGLNNYQYATNGLDEPGIANAPPIADIFINGERQLNPSEAGKTSGGFSGAIADADLPIVLGTGLGGYDDDPSNKQFEQNAHFYGRLAEVNYFLTMKLGEQAIGINENLDRPSDFITTYRETIARGLMNGQRQPASGITNISERLLLRDLDESSTHPTVRRSGDQRRLGNHSIKFDDASTQTLRGTQIHYPTKLVKGDNLIDTIYAGYFNGNLTTVYTASTDSYDVFYRRADQPSQEPFVESRIYVDSGSSFYQTGTLESVLPGFDRPLHSKEVVEIELVNRQQCQLGFFGSSDPTVTSHLINRAREDYMAYWNSTGFFERKPGYTFHGASTTINNATAQNNILTGSCIGFLGTRNTLTASTLSGFDATDDQTWGSNLTISAYPDEYFRGIGKPTDLFAFPDDQRYFATGSNLINMADYIAEPFLVEKIVYEFDSIIVNPDSAGTSTSNSSGQGYDGFQGFINNPAASNEARWVRQTYGLEALHCFLLRQYPKNVQGSRPVKWQAAIGANAGFISGSATFESETQRELIDYQSRYFTVDVNTAGGFTNESIGFFVHPSPISALIITASSPPIFSSPYTNAAEYIAERFALNPVTDVQFLDSITNATTIEKFRLESTVKTAERRTHAGDILTIDPTATTTTAGVVGTWTGGPGSISDERSVRHIVKSSGGKKNPQSIGLALFGGIPPGGRTITTVLSEADGAGDAPYVLMPEDNLIFGLQSLPPKQANAVPTSSNIKIPAGNIRLRLFGSYLRNSQPRQFELNQLLNNDIVHEAIGQESIHDQFDIEPRGLFSGSYVDEVVSGSVTAPYNGFNASIHVDGDGSGDFTNLARRVIGRSSEGTQGVTGSLRRTLSIVSSDKTEYDSFLFDLESVWKTDARIATTPSNFINGGYYNDFNGGTTSAPRPLDLILATNDPDLETDVFNSVGTTGAVKPNIDFRTSYIFDRYNHITRVRNSQLLAQNNEALLYLTGSSLYNDQGLDGYLATNPDAPPSEPYDDADGDDQFVAIYGGSPTAWGSRYANSLEVSRLLFGLGEGPKSAHYFDHAPSWPSDDVGFFFIRDIRGFKYGLSNIADKKPRNVFRRDRYGQLRDMLEMAPNTAYVDDATNTISYPLEAQFFASDGSIVSPDATSCSNLSTNLTSSAPFFDRDIVEFDDPLVVRNRGPLNNRVVDITIEI